MYTYCIHVFGTDLAVLSERVVAIEARIGTSIPIVTNGAAEDKDEEEFDLFGSDDVRRLICYVKRSQCMCTYRKKAQQCPRQRRQ